MEGQSLGTHVCGAADTHVVLGRKWVPQQSFLHYQASHTRHRGGVAVCHSLGAEEGRRRGPVSSLCTCSHSVR